MARRSHAVSDLRAELARVERVERDALQMAVRETLEAVALGS
jgi:hypothetical protein